MQPPFAASSVGYLLSPASGSYLPLDSIFIEKIFGNLDVGTVTIVVAKKIGGTIYVLSDTMLSVRHAKRDDMIPGVLKSIVIALNFTISFSGNYTRAIDTVRRAKKLLADTRDVDQVLRYLTLETIDDECSFIASFHHQGAELRKIWQGNMSARMQACWIGDDEVANMILNLEPSPIRPSDGHAVSEEDLYASGLTAAFQNSFMRYGPRMNESVGGFPVIQLSSPFGHTYGNYAGGGIWTDSGSGSPDSFSYSVHPPGRRGVAVLGIYYPEAQAAYIYSPITEDHPVSMPAHSVTDMNEELEARALAQGGVYTWHRTKPAQGF